MEIYPVCIKCSIWPPLRLATSSTRTVMLITRQHISSVISLQTWMINAPKSIIVRCFFRKIFALSNPPKNSPMDLNQDYSEVSSVHMRNDQKIGLRWHTSRKRHAESPKQHSLYAACPHPAQTTECVTANLYEEGDARKYCATYLNSTHCSLSFQRKLALAVHDLRWQPTP
jgi:hypothetical protein